MSNIKYKFQNKFEIENGDDSARFVNKQINAAINELSGIDLNMGMDFKKLINTYTAENPEEFVKRIENIYTELINISNIIENASGAADY